MAFMKGNESDHAHQSRPRSSQVFAGIVLMAIPKPITGVTKKSKILNN